MSKSKLNGVGGAKGYGRKPKAMSDKEQAFLANERRLANQAKAINAAFHRDQRRRARRIEQLFKQAQLAARPDDRLCPICQAVVRQDKLRKHLGGVHRDVL